MVDIHTHCPRDCRLTSSDFQRSYSATLVVSLNPIFFSTDEPKVRKSAGPGSHVTLGKPGLCVHENAFEESENNCRAVQGLQRMNATIAITRCIPFRSTSAWLQERDAMTLAKVLEWYAQKLSTTVVNRDLVFHPSIPYLFLSFGPGGRIGLVYDPCLGLPLHQGSTIRSK